jgi:hypothetical protein
MYATVMPQVVEKVLLADQPTKQLVKPEDLAAMVLHADVFAADVSLPSCFVMHCAAGG